MWLYPCDNCLLRGVVLREICIRTFARQAQSKEICANHLAMSAFTVDYSWPSSQAVHRLLLCSFVPALAAFRTLLSAVFNDVIPSPSKWQARRYCSVRSNAPQAPTADANRTAILQGHTALTMLMASLFTMPKVLTEVMSAQLPALSLLFVRYNT